MVRPAINSRLQSSEVASRLRSFDGFPVFVFRYVGAEFFISFLVSFAFFFFMFFINQLLLLAEDILQKDVPLWDVVRLIIYSLPSIIALSVPFATLVGTLMAVGRLSSDNEVVALRASGFSLRRIFSPVLLAAALLSVLSFFVNDFLLPLGTLNFGRLYRELLYANPALELEAYSIKRYQDDVLITGAVEPGRLEHFTIIDTDGQGNQRVITAGEARLIREGDPNAISLELSDVTTHSAVSASDHNYSYAGTMRYNILLQDITVAIRSPGPREMSARDVRAEIRQKEDELAPHIEEWTTRVTETETRLSELRGEVERGEASHEELEAVSTEFERISRQRPFNRSLQIHRLEYHKKFSIPFAALSFVFLAFPLGLFSKRSGRSVGFGIGLLIATLYWSMLIAGQTIGSQRPHVPPAAAMWFPNVMFLVVGIVVFLKKARQ